MDKTKPSPTLSTAYGVSGPEENRRLYRDWAATYDEDFVAATDYVYPHRIAAIFEAEGGTGPVLDVGCGTGAVAAALRARPVDGVDISSEMLAAAGAKGLYRNLIEADLTAPGLPVAAYDGVVSAGTFTHGHVGPEALVPLVAAARPGALFVIGVNAEVFAKLPFRAVLDGLIGQQAITDLRIVEGRIYGDGATHDHATDQFCAVVFRRR